MFDKLNVTRTFCLFLAIMFIQTCTYSMYIRYFNGDNISSRISMINNTATFITRTSYAMSVTDIQY